MDGALCRLPQSPRPALRPVLRVVRALSVRPLLHDLEESVRRAALDEADRATVARGRVHRMSPRCRVSSDAAGGLLVAAVAVRRPDRNVSLMLVNSALTSAHTVLFAFQNRQFFFKQKTAYEITV